MSTNKKLVALLVAVGIVLGGYLYSSKGGEEGRIRIVNFTFCSEKPLGYESYEPKENSIFEIGKKVWVYCELENVSFSTKRVKAGKAKVWISRKLTLKRDNEVVTELKRIGTPRLIWKDRIKGMHLNFPIDTGSKKYTPGKYKLILTVRDKLNGTSDSYITEFTLKNSKGGDKS